ncbi:MAG TPA: anti-sigma factor [Actinomycetes bacterium]|nr:anti-sigma factor [Actinomycetes bacterium]
MSEQAPDHEMHLLTGAYAADALDAGERDAFEVHLETCDACRQEVAELTATTARLGSAEAVPPPPGLRARVLEEVARTRQLPPGGDLVDLQSTMGRRRRWYPQPVAAAAAVLLVVAVGLGALAAAEHHRADQARDREQQISALVGDPDATVKRVAVAGGGSGTVISNGSNAVFLARDLPELPSGRAYQLWRIRGQSPESAGLLGRGGDATTLVDGVAPSDSIAVTVEPSSGSERPTSSPVFLVSLA